MNIKYLKKYPEIVEFISGTKPTEEGGKVIETEVNGKTPEEELEQGYQKIRNTLASDILDQIKTCSPQFFEQLVVDLMLAMGYGGSRVDAGQAVGKSGDGGIDGIIKEDKLGLDFVYLQAKRWENQVPISMVHAFCGSLAGKGANKGVLITTSSFSKGAYDYVKNLPNQKIVLIDGDKLAELMIDHDLGVSTAATYEVKKIDLDYFTEE